MQTANQLDLESLKLVNQLYVMRHFITAPIFQAEKFKIWLYIKDHTNHLTNEKYIATIESFNSEFRSLFSNQDHIDVFLNALLGEEVGKDTYLNGLIHNKPRALYTFLCHPNQAKIKQFLQENLSKLNEAWQSWQAYEDTHCDLKKLLTQCKIEVDKRITRIDVDFMMKENRRTRNQPTIKRPSLNSKKQPAPSRSIPLDNPEDFPCINKLLRATTTTDIKLLAKYIALLINIDQSMRKLPGTAHLPLLIKLDEIILKALLQTDPIHLVNYCTLVTKSIPEGFIVGRGWSNNTFIEQYWQTFAELLKSHLSHDPNPQLQEIIDKLTGANLAVDDASSVHTQIVSSQETPVSSQPLPQQEIARSRVQRWTSDISAQLARHIQRTQFLVDAGIRSGAKRSASAPVLVDLVTRNGITVGDGSSGAKRRRL